MLYFYCAQDDSIYSSKKDWNENLHNYNWLTKSAPSKISNTPVLFCYFYLKLIWFLLIAIQHNLSDLLGLVTFDLLLNMQTYPSRFIFKYNFYV